MQLQQEKEEKVDNITQGGGGIILFSPHQHGSMERESKWEP